MASRTHRLVAASFVLTVIALVGVPAPDAQAQCNRNCAAGTPRDARGCCLAPKPPPPRPGAGKPAKPPPPRKCSPGQQVTPDTAGHCCWPGQVWTNNRCVGVPTSCPAGHEVDGGGQQCRLIPCKAGRVRANDGLHCCFSGQGWSATRNTCVGIPSCPAGFEARGETCVSDDLDSDGTPNAKDKCPEDPEDRDGFQDGDGCPDKDNDGDGFEDARDKCPNEGEDKNNFEDDDGCPDEKKRAGIVAAEAAAAAEAERQRRLQEEMKQAEAAERARQEQEAAAAAEAERQRAAAAEREAKARAAHEKKRSEAGKRRLAGTILLIGGGSTLVLTGVFAGLGAGQNGVIQDGGLATGQAIEDEASTGNTYNFLMGLSVVGTVGMLGPGVPLFFSGFDPGPYGEAKAPTVEVAVTPTGLVARGTIP